MLLLGALISQAQWQSDVRLVSDPGNSQMDSYPNAHCIASSEDMLHLVWTDNRDGASNEIYHKQSTDGGLNWGSDIRISNNVYSSRMPSVCISGSVVIIVWSYKRDGIYDNNYEIYYTRSSDGGTSWSADTRLTNNPSISESPSVSVSGTLVIAIWDDYRDAEKLKTYYIQMLDRRSNKLGNRYEAPG